MVKPAKVVSGGAERRWEDEIRAKVFDVDGRPDGNGGHNLRDRYRGVDDVGARGSGAWWGGGAVDGLGLTLGRSGGSGRGG